METTTIHDRSRNYDSPATSFARYVQAELQLMKDAIDIGHREVRLRRGNWRETEQSVKTIIAKMIRFRRNIGQNHFARRIVDECAGPREARDILRPLVDPPKPSAADKRREAELVAIERKLGIARS